MDILIPDSWLKDFLVTRAKAEDIARLLSLCGPSVERIIPSGKDKIYAIEVTGNRVDSASVFGIAREAAAILPMFGYKTHLNALKVKSNQTLTPSVNYLNVRVDNSLCQRFTAILIKDVTIGKSPAWLSERLTKVGIRSLNNIVDISNYLMIELGQPVHTFDYDKILGKKMILRASKKGEVIETLDHKKYELPGGDIVIEDGVGRLIDLAGIMGGVLSAVSEKTKNVLLFVQTYNPIAIRQTSMKIAKRTEASSLFEKDLDPEIVIPTIRRGIDLFVEITSGKPDHEILDIYKKDEDAKKIILSQDFINSLVGVEIKSDTISKILTSLGFNVSRKDTNYEIGVPSFRAKDIKNPEDVVEEIARIYGYFNLPSLLPEGRLPQILADAPFTFEEKVKNILKGYGGTEIYTLSLVSDSDNGRALKLRNPLGSFSEYLRTSLKGSLLSAFQENSGKSETFHLFEMSNVYLPTPNSLPVEKLTIAGIIAGVEYRLSKGIIEALMDELRIDCNYKVEDAKGFIANGRLVVRSENASLGEMGILENKSFYYEFDMESLRKVSRELSKYTPIPKNPPQIEDITITLPEKTYLGEVISAICKVDKRIYDIQLFDAFKNNYSFRIWYLDANKTLTDKEVNQIRKKILSTIKAKFGGFTKEK